MRGVEYSINACCVKDLYLVTDMVMEYQLWIVCGVRGEDRVWNATQLRSKERIITLG